MQYTSLYPSPLGTILLAADDIGLTGLWFDGQRNFARALRADCREADMPILRCARSWLEIYFQGHDPSIPVPLHLVGTQFQEDVWALLLCIPYGETRSYGELAMELAKLRGLARMSAQAVGGAVARNPVSIIVPCHRVIGADGRLNGYAGGLERKRALLNLERRKIKES